MRNDIHVIDGILLKDNRLVIPSAWRKDVLQKLHLSHCGIEKSKANARMTVFWPGMTKDIEEMVSSCEKCMTYKSKQPKEPLPPHANTRYPTITMAGSCIRYIRTQKSTLSCGH